jgi:hypothetical protein
MGWAFFFSARACRFVVSNASMAGIKTQDEKLETECQTLKHNM